MQFFALYCWWDAQVWSALSRRTVYYAFQSCVTFWVCGSNHGVFLFKWRLNIKQCLPVKLFVILSKKHWAVLTSESVRSFTEIHWAALYYFNFFFLLLMMYKGWFFLLSLWMRSQTVTLHLKAQQCFCSVLPVFWFSISLALMKTRSKRSCWSYGNMIM